MIQIPQPSLTVARLPEGDATQTPAPSATNVGPEYVAVVVDAAPTDPQAKFDALFGAAAAQHFYADANGAGGGQTKATRKNADPLAGADVPGQKGVVVQRSLGEARGYETKNHALAWARAAGSERAMVVLGKDKRWHAVETNVVAKDGAGGTGAIKSAIQVGKVDQATYDRLKGEALKNNDPGKWKTFAAYALGLPESEIEVIGKGDTASSTKVNINLSPDFNAEGRTAGFDPKQPPWVQLGPAAFDRPANAAATLAHEEVHADHRRLTGELYKKYEASPHGSDSFRKWAANNIKDVRLVDIVAGYADGTTAATELEAHVEAARVAFASGDLKQAETDLRKVATLPALPMLKTQLASIDVLKKLRDNLPEDARNVFKAVAEKAKASSVMHGL